jgi:uncharacterized repeat protein (TIGR01451 family)
VAGNLDGQTLTPGLYNSSSTLGLGVGGVLYLNGPANSVFIFQVGSALNMSNSSQVILEGGVTAANVFWQVGSAATLGTYSTFYGTIMAYAGVTLQTGATLYGRALAGAAGPVIMDSNPMANPGPPITSPTPPALTVTCPLATAQVGVAYNSLLAATGGTPPYTFSTTGSLPPGLVSVIPATGLLIGTPTLAGTFPFSANVLDSALATGTSSCSIAVAAASADVSIVKSGPATAATNANITYNMVVTNAGPSLAASVTASDILPAGTTFVSATPLPAGSSCSFTSSTRTVSCSLGTMAPGGLASVQLVVLSPSSPQTVSDTATASSPTPDPNLANNTSNAVSTVVTGPPPTVTCPLGAGQVGVAYNSPLTATGGTPLYTFSTTGSLPPGLSLLSPSTGAITGTPTGTGGAYTFTASVRDSASPTPGTATSSCSITVVAAQADVSIIKTATPATVSANANINYTLTVTNLGPSLAVNVIVGDILPKGTTVSGTLPAGCSGTSTISCSLGNMAALASATITLVVTGPSTYGPVANTATVASDTLDSNLANNTSTATVTVIQTAIPTLSTWGLALLALLLLLAGCSTRFGRKANS